MSATTTDSAQASLNVAHRAPAASGSRGAGSAPLRSTEELRALAEAGARELGDDAPALDVAQWAAQNFPDTLAVACSMADAVLPHVVSRVLPGVDVLFLDTGYHFAETVGTRDAVAATMDVTVVDVTPELSVAEQDACCRLRKVEPLARALSGYEAWATGVRREDAPTRTSTPLIGWDATHEIVKINPLAAWSMEELTGYADQHGVLINPLLYDGYPSIGCAPCTARVKPGDDPRSGRWAGFTKTECGIHL